MKRWPLAHAAEKESAKGIIVTSCLASINLPTASSRISRNCYIFLLSKSGIATIQKKIINFQENQVRMENVIIKSHLQKSEDKRIF